MSVSEQQRLMVKKLLDVVYDNRVPADVQATVAAIVAALLPVAVAPPVNYRISTSVENIPVPADLHERIAVAEFGSKISMSDVLTKLQLPRAQSVMIAVGRAMSKLNYESRRLNDHNRREHFYVKRSQQEKHANHN